MFNKNKRKESISYELDKSREGIDRLSELTNRLAIMEEDVCKHDGFIREIINNLDNPMWCKNIDGHFLFLNRAYATLVLKTTVSAALDLRDTDFKDNVLAKVCIESDRKVIETSETKRFIEHAQYSDYDLWLDIIKSPLIMSGKLIGTVGSAKDITEIVSKDIKDSFVEAQSMELPLNFVYCIKDKNTTRGKRKCDLDSLLEKNMGKEVI